MLAAYLNWLFKYQRSVIFVSLLVAVVTSLGVLKITTSSDFRAFFGEENAELLAFEAMEDTFNKQEGIFFYIRANEGTIFTKRGLTLIAQLTDIGWQMPFANRVMSLQNYQHTQVHGDELTTGDLYRHPENLTPEDIGSIQNIVANEPTLQRRLISTSQDVSAVAISMVLPEDRADNHNAKEGVARARQIRDEFQARYPDFELRIGGTMVTNVTMGEVIIDDARLLVACSYLMMIVVLMLMLRTVSGVIITLTIITLSVGASMGIFGWMGLIMTPPTAAVPSAIMTVAVADTIHILASYYYELNHGRDKIGAIQESMRINFNPVFVTSLTTLAGVLTLNFSESPPYHDMGNMIALGVTFAWLFTVIFLPALLAILPAPQGQANKPPSRAMNHVGNFVIGRYRSIFVVTLLLTLLLGMQLPRNQITERWHEFFPPDFEARATLEKTNASLGGLHSIFYIMETGADYGINSPEYLQKLDDFAAWALTQPKVSSVDSFSDIIKRLNKTMHNDDPAYYTIPKNRDLVAQYLLLYEMSLPSGLGLDDLINPSHSATRFGIIFEKSDSAYILELEQKATAWLKHNAPEIKIERGTGLDMVFSHLAFNNANSMIKGTVVAMIAISIMLIFALNSLRAGLISLIPNVIPAVIAYGIWGVFHGEIDSALSIVVCMSLGIVVDDTVHFLSKYLRARREQGLGIEDAIRYAFNTVGSALVVTSMVLIGGFSVMELSSFLPSRNIGRMLTITIAVALLCDFFLLPAILMMFDSKKYAKAKKWLFFGH